MDGFSTVTRSTFQWLWHHYACIPFNHNDLFYLMHPTALDVAHLLSSVVRMGAWGADQQGSGVFHLYRWRQTAMR